MEKNENYSLGLLYLIYLLINSDTEISEKELNYLSRIRETEGISKDVFTHFHKSIIGKSESEIYHNGINYINDCTHDFKLRAFIRLYQMAQADGIMHVKEVRLLLYAVKMTHVDINAVIAIANQEILV